ncbi:MAG: RHS repeat-associated core domain-containing protein [Terriglobales bacterium]
MRTPRTQTDPTGNTDGSAYTNGPWGEGGSNALPGDLGFTGDLFDNPDGEVFHTPNRKYSPMQGRWMIPDPAGVAAVDVANPQSWNRYAYVLNNPVSLIDPLGLYCFYGGDGDTPENDSDPTDYDFGATSSDDCGDGGQWIDTSTQVTVNGDSPDDPGVTIENGQQVFPEVVGLQPSFGDCVKNSGNYFSLQNMLGLGDAKGAAGFLAGAALGNPVSDAIAFGQGLADHNASAAGGSGASAAIGLVDPDGQALDAASHLQDVTVAATSVSVTTVQAPGASVTVVSVDTASLTIPLGTLASIAKPLATAAKGANIWNYGVSAVSAMICGIGR